MKKVNILYIAGLAVLVGLWCLGSQYGKTTDVFYGFAENKETEINLEHPVQVNLIHVSPGQKVSQGTLLAEVSKTNLPLKLNEVEHEIEELKLQHALWEDNIKGNISQLIAQRAETVNEFESKIQALQAEIDRNKSLVKGLKSISTPSSSGSSLPNPNELKIKSLRAELELALKPIDLKIRQNREKLRTPDNPYKVRIRKQEKDREFYTENEKRLTLLAPSDGLVGNIHCKEAENVSSFNTLITFYEESPTLVKGYVHESMILHVRVGDTVSVGSTLHPEQLCPGIVTGLGSRIVEIPERLRKVPEFKTYGREVLIQIPPKNPFLQKEKVIMNLYVPGGFTKGWFPSLGKKPMAENPADKPSIR